MNRPLQAVAFALAGAVAATPLQAETTRTEGPCSPIIQNVQGNVSVTFSGGCTTGLTREQAKELIDGSMAQAQAVSREMLDRVDQLSRQFGVTDNAMRNFFRLLGEQNVGPEDLDGKLRQIAARHLSLEQQVRQLPNSDSAAPTKRQARLDIEAGAYNRAETLLAAARDQVRAVELLQRGQPEQALASLRATEQRLAVVSADPSTDVRLVLGYLHKTFAQALTETGDRARADQHLDLALQSFEPIRDDPKLKAEHPTEFASAINGIGNIHYARGQYREAIADYQLATSLVPGYAYAWHDMFITYLALAQRGETDLKAMRQALDKTKATGQGAPALDAKYIAGLERRLADLERSANPGRKKK